MIVLLSDGKKTFVIQSHFLSDGETFSVQPVSSFRLQFFIKFNTRSFLKCTLQTLLSIALILCKLKVKRIFLYEQNTHALNTAEL